MQKLLACFVLLGSMVALSGIDVPYSVAQTKKDAKGAAVIEIGEGKDGKFRLTIRDAEGKFLALSAAHATEKEARAAIDELRDALNKAKVVVKKAEKDKEKAKKTDKEKSEK